MKKKWTIRAISWFLSVIMILTSSGITSMTALAADATPVNEQAEADDSNQEQESETESDAGADENLEIKIPKENENSFGNSTIEADRATSVLVWDEDIQASYVTATANLKLVSIDGTAPNGSYNVDCYIKPSASDGGYQQFGWYQSLDSTYAITINDIQYNYQPLTPGTEYTLKLALRYNNEIIGESEFRFTTKNVTVNYTEKLVTWFSADIDIAVANKGQLKAEGLDSLTVYPYLQEKGGEIKKVNPYSLDVFKDSISLTGLKDETDYTLYLAGTRDSATPYISKYDFKTIKDTRKVTEISNDIQYCYASFDVAIEGGRDDVNTICYLFLRKEGDETWMNNKQAEKKEAFSKTLRIDGLDSETKYEYVLAIGDDWNVNAPDAITKQGHKISGTFTTPKDPRELKTIASAGYQTALLQTGYTGNDIYAHTVIHAFVREVAAEGSEPNEWVEQKNASYDQGNSFDLLFKDLKQDTEYEYRVILNSKWDDTTADTTVKELQYNEGTFKTKLCTYTLSLTPDEKRSIYNREYLNIQLKDSKLDREVIAQLYFSNDAEKKISLYRDEDYKDTFSIRELEAQTTYFLKKYELYVKEFGQTVCIYQKDCEENEYSFTTPEAIAPTSLFFEKEEIYLNLSQADEDNVGYLQLKPIVNEGACDEMLWESKDPAIATVDENGIVVAKGIGETEIVATSKYDATITKSVKVYVDELYAYIPDSNGGGSNVGDTTIKGLKGTQSEPVTIMKETETGIEVIGVTGYSAERQSVVKYDIKTNIITFDAVGTTKLYLEYEGYKVRVNTESYIKTAAYYVDSLSNKKYPGIEVSENTYDILVDQVYQINLKSINGDTIKDYNNFNITMEPADSTAVTVNVKNFKLTAVSETTAPIKITISPKEGTEYDNEYYADAVFYVNVKSLPEENVAQMYVLVNEDKFLSDVELEQGWKWENEKVALYALRKTQSYVFKAYYALEDHYPISQDITVHIGEIKDLKVEDLTKTNYSVTAGLVDKIEVKISFASVGKIDAQDLAKRLTANSDDVTITLKSSNNNEAVYEIAAKTAGSYELTASVFSTQYNKDILQKKIVLTASEDSFVRSIRVFNTSKTPAEEITEEGLLLDSTLDIGSTITLKATPFDYAEKEMEGQNFIWTTTDKTVAMVSPAGKNDSINANLLIKGEGNAVITVKSTDVAGVSYSFIVEVKNIAPRLNGNKVTVNTALDYRIGEGRDIAYKYYGFIELVEAYDNKITSIDYYKKTKKTFELEEEAGKEATVFNYNVKFGVGNKRDIIPMPIDPDLKNGKYEIWVVVKTELSEAVYTYPVTITVMKKAMKVKAVSDNINTFYMLRNNDDIAYTFTGDYINNPTVTWVQKSNDHVGFKISKYIYYNETKKKWCSSVDTSALEMNGKVPADGTAIGTLSFEFRGYRDLVVLENFKIKNCYKIPKIVSVASQTTVSTACGIDKAAFYLYQSDAKKRISYHDEESKYRYSSYKCNIEEVNVYPTSDYSDWMEYVYTGENKVENVLISLRSNYWREKVVVKHRINNVAPTLILEKPKMTFNWNLPGMDTSVLLVKKAQNGAILKDVIVTGKNAAAQQLIDENVFTFTLGDNKYLDVKLNYIEALNKKYKDGTYSFDVKPVFINTITGKEVTGKACVLKLTLTSKAPVVNLYASGSIDLAKYPMLDWWEFYKNAVKIKYTFKNVNSNYEEIGREVIGDYADYFEIWWSDAGNGWYLVPKPGMEGKLKAGFVYNIQIKFTLKMKDGVTTEIISKPYKLKLKQSSVGVKITPKPQVMYLSNDDVTREYEVTVSNAYYRIDSITGALDVNKDGKNDLIVSKVSKKDDNRTAVVTIKIVDRDAISTTLKGKSYSIPIEVMLRGADGVSKNVKTKISVTVKK